MSEELAQIEEKEAETKLTPAAGYTGPLSMVPKTLGEAMQYAELLAASQLCPKEYQGRPQDVLIAMQMGLEVAGCSPLQAVQNIAVINGRPSMWGDLVLAVVKRSGLLVRIEERGQTEAAELGEGHCEVQRKDEEPVVRTFTMEEAKTAGLLSKDSPWKTYPGRMLQMRARGFALRDVFPDVLKGLWLREEAMDIVHEEGGVQVLQPRRASDVPERSVSEFLSDAEKQSGPSPSQAPRRRAPVPEGDEGKWVGVVVQIVQKEAGKGKLYIVHGEDGHQFTSFDRKHADIAHAFKEQKEPAAIFWKKNGKYVNIDKIVLASELE